MITETPVSPTRLDREAIYTEQSARIAMRIPASTLARARKDGTLRYARRGQTIYYIGAWLADWIEAGEVRSSVETADPEVMSGV